MVHKNKQAILTSRPAFLCLLTSCFEEYRFPGGTDSLNVSSRGTLDGMILSIGSPNAGQSNQPEIAPRYITYKIYMRKITVEKKKNNE